MAKRDWLLENLNNPNLDVFELTQLGELNTDNTQFLSKAEYLKHDKVREYFTDQKGNFDKQLFDNFYNYQAYRWNEMQTNEFPVGLELSVFDTDRRPSSRIKDYNFYLGEDRTIFGTPGNPDRVNKGIEGFKTISKKTKSAEELAQFSKIFDTKNNKFIDQTPNDIALLKNPINWVKQFFVEDPLVLATYDEDTVDEYGIKHKKGEYKFNELGTYYYETLGDRSYIGKRILSAADLITPENSTLNNIDFFDSDDLHKSAAGVIAKNVALVAPMFTPVAPWYYRAIIAKELAKTIPMLGSMVSLINPTYETPDRINKLASRGQALTTNVSEYSKQNVFTFENIANLMSDVALQWGQQKEIAKLTSFYDNKSRENLARKQAYNFYKTKAKNPRLQSMVAQSDDMWEQSVLGQASLRKFVDPVVEQGAKRQKLGQYVALIYMAMISNQDVYNDMIRRGATQQEAALVSAGSTIGMFSVDKYLGLGEMFFDDAKHAIVRETREVISKEVVDAVNKTFGKGVKSDAKNLFMKALDASKKATNKLMQRVQDKSLGLFGKAVGEGLEEVTEEFVTDISRTLYEFGIYNAALGYDNTVQNVGAFENSLERYGMSLLGGFLGGGLYGISNRQYYNKTQDRDLVQLIRDKRGNELRQMVHDAIKNGECGSTTLSAKISGYDTEGKPIFLTTTNPEESQNQVIGNLILDKINSLEATIIGNNAALNDDELFNNMILQDARYIVYKNASHAIGYYDEYEKRLSKILQSTDEYNRAVKTKTGTPNDKTLLTDSEERKLSPEEEALRSKNLAQLQANIDKAKADFDEFLSGKTSLWYTRKLDFALDPRMNAAFLGLDYGKWLMDKLGSLESLDEDVLKLEKLQEEWEEHYKNTIATGLDDGFNAFLALEDAVKGTLLQQQELSPNYTKVMDVLNKMFKDDPKNMLTYIAENQYYTWDSKLNYDDGTEDTDEQLSYIQELYESEQLPVVEYANRQKRAYELNTRMYQQYLTNFTNYLNQIGWKVDASTARQLVQRIGLTFNDALAEVLRLYYEKDGELINLNGNYIKALTKLSKDFSNKDQIKNEIEKIRIGEFHEMIPVLQNKMVSDLFMKLNPDITSAYVNLDTKLLVRTPKPYEGLVRKAIKELSENISDLNPEQIENLTKLQQIFEKYKQLKSNENDKRNNGLESEADAILEEREKLALDMYSLLNTFKDFMFKQTSTVGIFSNEGKSFYGDLINEIQETNLKDTSINSIIEQLSDPKSKLYNSMRTYYSDNTITLIKDLLKNTTFRFGKDADIRILQNDDELSNYLGNTAQTQIKTRQDYVDFVINNLNSHPVQAFYNKLKTTLKSPVQDMFKSVGTLMTEDSKELFNLNQILDLIYKDFIEISDISKFTINPTLTKQLTNATDILKMLEAVIYASTNPIIDGNYFGQNQQINEFVRRHAKDIDLNWQELPELPNDYGGMLISEINRLKTEVDYWQRLAANGAMRKADRMSDTEEKDRELRASFLNTLKLKFTFDDREYELNPTNIKTENLKLNDLFVVEQEIHNNFKEMLKSEKINPNKFFSNPKVWDTLLTQAEILSKQITTRLDENMESLTPYDQLMYLLTILSDNPSEYYKSLGYFIKDNKDIVPITIQQIGSRIAQAAHNPIFKTAVKHLYKHLGIDHLNLIENGVYLNGVGGAGKTDAQLKPIRQRFHNEKPIIFAPTKDQASKLADVLGETEYYVLGKSENGVTNLFEALLTEQQWNSIKKEYDDIVKKINGVSDKTLKEKGSVSFDGTYFKATVYPPKTVPSSNTVFELKNNIVFNSDFDHTLIFGDEAAHMNALEIVLLNQYARKKKATMFLASDNSQNGYENGKVSNLGVESIFTIRTPKLQESLRSSNIQKQDNDRKLGAMLDQFDDLFKSDDKMAEAFIERMQETMPKIGLRLYEKDDINGYMFDAKIDDSLLKRIPKNKKIGFIGNSDSANYQKLKNAGYNVSALSEHVEIGKSHMQGQEFDYVIIDSLENLLTNESNELGFGKKFENILFLKRIYTLATRGKQAAIFVDDLSPYFGKINTESIKSDTYDISEQFKNYTEKYLQNLAELKLEETSEETPKEEEKKEKEEKKEEEKQVEEKDVSEEEEEEEEEEELPKVDGETVLESPIKADEAIEDQEEQDFEKISQEIIENSEEIEAALSETAEQVTNENFDLSTGDIQLTIEANLVAPIIGLKQITEEGKKFPTWIYPEKPKEGELRRNAAALYFNTDREGAYSVARKKEIQKSLSSIQSVVRYGGNLTGELSKFTNFSDVWKKRKLHLEFRQVNFDTDYFGVGSGLEQSFIQIGDKTYIISLVLELNGLHKSSNDDPFDAMFDICLLNDPNKLSDPKQQKIIKDRLQTLLKEGKIASSRQQDVTNFCNNLSNIAREWSMFVETVIKNENVDQSGYRLELDVQNYHFHKITGLHHIDNPIRLGGTLSLSDYENNVTDEEGNHPYDRNTFLDVDNRKVVSPVYIAGKKSKSGYVSESVLGRAVVFVSDNTNLSPDSLAKLWIEQQKNKDNSTAVVRMVPLTNHGVSFKEFITHGLQKIYEGQGKPHRMDVLGVKMFASLWNFRAALKQFNDILSTWSKEKGYNDDKLKAIAEAEYYLFNQYSSENWTDNWDKILNNPKYQSTVEKILSEHSVTTEDIKNLMEFNLEVCKNIPIYRLGHDVTTEKVGGYVRPFDVKNSTVKYRDKRANLFAINVDTAKKHLNLLNELLKQITANEVPDAITSAGIDYKPIGIRLAYKDGTSVKPEDYIGEGINKFAGMVRTTADGLVINYSENGENLEYSVDNRHLFSFVPKTIAMIAKAVKVYQSNPSRGDLITISTIHKVGENEVKDDMHVTLGDFFGKDKLSMDTSDNSLFQLLYLVFHGTTGSIENMKGKPRAAYLENAYFKYGILVDPELEMMKNYELENVLGQDKREWTFLRCGTNPIFFDVNVEVRPGGAMLRLSDIMELYKTGKSKAKSEVAIETEEAIINSYIATMEEGFLKDAFENAYENDSNVEDSEEGFNEWLESYTDQMLHNYFSEIELDEEVEKFVIFKIKEKIGDGDIVKEDGEIRLKNSNGTFTLTLNDFGQINQTKVQDKNEASESEEQKQYIDCAKIIKDVLGTNEIYRDIINEYIGSNNFVGLVEHENKSLVFATLAELNILGEPENSERVGILFNIANKDISCI